MSSMSVYAHEHQHEAAHRSRFARLAVRRRGVARPVSCLHVSVHFQKPVLQRQQQHHRVLGHRNSIGSTVISYSDALGSERHGGSLAETGSILGAFLGGHLQSEKGIERKMKLTTRNSIRG